MKTIMAKELIEVVVGQKVIRVDPASPFEFIGIDDTGVESGATCPHCGAEGRYIYNWIEHGRPHAAMAGCFAALTGRVKKGDYEKVMIGIAKKQATRKPINGWEKTILRMNEFKSTGKYPDDWCNQKIHEVLSQRKAFLSQRGYSW